MVLQYFDTPNNTDQIHHSTHRQGLHPILQSFQAGLADPSVGQPGQATQFFRVSLIPNSARRPHVRLSLVLLQRPVSCLQQHQGSFSQ